MTVYLVISLPKRLYIHRIYMVLANPRHVTCGHTPVINIPPVLLFHPFAPSSTLHRGLRYSVLRGLLRTLWSTPYSVVYLRFSVVYSVLRGLRSTLHHNLRFTITTILYSVLSTSVHRQFCTTLSTLH